MRIRLTLRNYRCFPDSSPAELLIEPGLTAIVGVNNSGKSALLRALFEFRPLFEGLLANNLSQVVASLTQPYAFHYAQDLKDTDEPFSNMTNGPMIISVGVEDTPLITDAGSASEVHVKVLRDRGVTVEVERVGMPRLKQVSGLRGNGVILVDQHGSAVCQFKGMTDAFRTLASTIYLPAFRNAVNTGGGGKLFDMTIGQPFVNHWRTLKTGNTKRLNAAADELSEDIRRVLGFDKLEIDASEDATTLKLSIDRRSYRLDEVGSGIAQFILVLVNAAVRRPEFILIDEPELNLHPSLQLDFLATLNKYARSGTIFATHSLGLARTAATRIYATRRFSIPNSDLRASEVSEYNDSPHLAELLGSLNYAAYRQLGFEQVLLVEGPNDVLIFQELLRKFGIEHKVVLLNLGGASGISDAAAAQLGEIKGRICPHVRAVVDSERDQRDAKAAPNVLSFERICKKMGVPCCVTDLRAIENYFNSRSLKAAFPSANVRQLEPFERLDFAKHGFRKSEGWRAAREMSLNELNATEIGRFLKTIEVELNGGARRGG
jgi:ABC-type cobalamin/Fe3+-siderophores transport system ATPase subunit